MADHSAPRGRPRRRRGGAYRELIHRLNQQYRQQWARAEQLEGELARLRRWMFWPVFAWLKRVKRWLRPPVGEPPYLVGATPFEVRCGPSLSERVSLIIPFKDRPELLQGCLRSLRASSYQKFEIILIDNGSTDPRTHRLLWRLGSRRRLRIVDAPGTFNFSRLCNLGAAQARGQVLVFLNNDTEVLTPDWLERMLEVLTDTRVGLVSATLLYPDQTLQHVGIYPRVDGSWVHAYRGRPADEEGDLGELRQVRAVPAATGACLMVHREVFQTLQGFDESLPVTFGDVDLCCRARDQGLLVAVTPHARLWHFEGLTRGYAVDAAGLSHLSSLVRLPSA